jgi:citrate lyase subunit beta / citryl-CoA lyase
MCDSRKPLRVRRSELSTPASSDKMIQKASESEADLVFLDLEDSVAPSAKADARQRAAAALRELDWGRKTRAVRINAISTPWAHEDLLEVVGVAQDALDVVIVPKVRTPQDVWWVDVFLSQLEARFKLSKRVGIEVLIEDVHAMVNVEEIAGASDRLEALIFGPGDYSASQGVRSSSIGKGTDTYGGDIWHYARNKIIIAARAAGVDAIDGPYAAFRDSVGFEEEASRAMALGAVGKWAIHPSQVEIANRLFSPTPNEIESARELCARYQEAEARGLGAIDVDGEMVDAATIRILQNTLDRAQLAGL